MQDAPTLKDNVLHKTCKRCSSTKPWHEFIFGTLKNTNPMCKECAKEKRNKTEKKRLSSIFPEKRSDSSFLFKMGQSSKSGR
jgi:hypothetical protein